MTCDAVSRVPANTAITAGGGIHNNGSTIILASPANVSGNDPDNCAGTAVPQCSG